MTSYYHHLTIDDSEFSSLIYAIRHMISYHTEQIEAGGTVPHFAHKITLEQLLPRLKKADMSMRSETVFVRLERPATGTRNNSGKEPSSGQPGNGDLPRPDD